MPDQAVGTPRQLGIRVFRKTDLGNGREMTSYSNGSYIISDTGRGTVESYDAHDVMVGYESKDDDSWHCEYHDDGSVDKITVHRRGWLSNMWAATRGQPI